MKLILLIVIFALLQQQTLQAGKCKGEYTRGVQNLCQAHFPDASSERIWFVKFYAPWCGHCKALTPKYQQLAKELKEDKDIGIGAVDCTQQENQGLCQKHGVKGYPTLKVFVNGKPKDYQGARETEQMKGFILNEKKKRGSAGGSAKCPKGIFTSGVKDSVVPLCSKHYPDQKSKNDWVILFYQKDQFQDREFVNKLSTELGNDPVDKLKRSRQNVSIRDRLENLGQQYNFDVKYPSQGGESKNALAKFGGVCCDCNEEAKNFCQQKGVNTYPSYSVFRKNKITQFEGQKEQLALFVLQNLGYVARDDL